MRGRRQRALAYAIAVVASSALLIVPAAQARSGLVFARAKPLSISWGQFVSGKRLKVCNGSGRTARRVTAVGGGFGFKSVEKGQAGSAVIEVGSPPARTVPAG